MGAGDVEVNVNTPNAKAGAIFDGVDDTISLGSFAFGKKATFAAWVKPHTLLADQCIFGDLNAGDVQWWLDTSGGFLRQSYNAGSTQNGTAADIPVDVWTHICISVTSTTTLFYKNGILDTAQIGAGDLSLPVNPDIHIGSDGNGSKWFNGEISDFQIYNRDLSSEEVLGVFNGKILPGITNRYELKKDYNDSVGSNNGTNAGSRLGIVDDTVAAAVKADRTGASDHYMIAQSANKQIITTIVEE